MNDFIISQIRTYVPIGVGLALTWLADTFGIVGVDSAAAGAIAVSLVSAAYYALARWLESKYPFARRMLGIPVAPTYESP